LIFYIKKIGCFQDEEDDIAEVTPLTEKVAGKTGLSNLSKNPQHQNVSNGEKEKLNNAKSSGDNNVMNILMHINI